MPTKCKYVTSSRRVVLEDGYAERLAEVTVENDIEELGSSSVWLECRTGSDGCRYMRKTMSLTLYDDEDVLGRKVYLGELKEFWEKQGHDIEDTYISNGVGESCIRNGLEEQLDCYGVNDFDGEVSYCPSYSRQPEDLYPWKCAVVDAVAMYKDGFYVGKATLWSIQNMDGSYYFSVMVSRSMEAVEEGISDVFLEEKASAYWMRQGYTIGGVKKDDGVKEWK